MSDPTPSLRDQGLQALQAGDIDKAVDCLGRAVMADDNDVDAKALLGIAYSTKGIHAQAKRALQTAVERAPQNPNYRFNLGVVLEKGGDLPGAAQAYRDTLQINPQHGQAKARLQAMGPVSMQGAPSINVPPPGPPSAPPPAPPVMPPPIGAAPPIGGPPPIGAVPGIPPPPPIGGPPIGGPPIGGPPIGGPQPGMGGMSAPQGPPGTVQCPRCGQFPKIGMTCEFCSAALPPPPRPTAPTGPAAFGSVGPVPGYVASSGVEDTFDVKQGFEDWWHVISGPKQFFAEQVGLEGTKGPAAAICAWAIFHGVTNGLLSLGYTHSGNVGTLGCSWLCPFLVTTGFMFVWAGILHGLSKLFGGQGSYSGSFRVMAYGSLPYLTAFTLFLLIGSVMIVNATKSVTGRSVQNQQIAAPAAEEARVQLVQFSPNSSGIRRFPASPGSSRLRTGTGTTSSSAALEKFGQIMGAAIPALVILALGFIWSLVVTGIGVAEVHQLSAGAAAGVVILTQVIINVILGVICFLLSAAIVAAVAAAMGQTGGAGAGSSPFSRPGGSSPFGGSGGSTSPFGR